MQQKDGGMEFKAQVHMQKQKIAMAMPNFRAKLLFRFQDITNEEVTSLNYRKVKQQYYISKKDSGRLYVKKSKNCELQEIP